MEEPRIEDYHDGVDGCELDEGGGDMGLDPSDYEDIEELPSLASTTSLLSHPMSRQPGLHIIMSNRNNDATPVMIQDILPIIVLSDCRL